MSDKLAPVGEPPPADPLAGLRAAIEEMGAARDHWRAWSCLDEEEAAKTRLDAAKARLNRELASVAEERARAEALVGAAEAMADVLRSTVWDSIGAEMNAGDAVFGWEDARMAYGAAAEARS